jgi:hypothetical protein
VSVAPPDWWASLQREVAALLTVPLDDDGGRFRARTERYASALAGQIVDDGPGVRARLALYHEQYWKRLFQSLQQAYPRTTRALGAFTFNRVAARHLGRHPPAAVDLAGVQEGFYAGLAAELSALAGPASQGYRVLETPIAALVARAPSASGGLLVDRGPSVVDAALAEADAPWSLVMQALALDEAERRALRAPREPPWLPSALERSRLRAARMRVAASFSLVRADFDLAADDPAQMRRRTSPQHHLVVRSQTGVATVRVDPLFARLLARSGDEPLGDAIAAVARAAQGPLRARLAENLEGYLERALELGVWVGVDFGPALTG